MGYGAVGINDWFLLSVNVYLSVGACTLLPSYLRHWMYFTASSIVDVRTLRFALNSI